MNEISSDILNRQLDALALIMNPPYLAPKDALPENRKSPGKNSRI
jgi:tRNA1(Val) A37 N6-methylase TrmN6